MEQRPVFENGCPTQRFSTVSDNGFYVIFACSGRQFPATPGIVSPFFPDSFPRDPLCRHTGIVRLNPALSSSIQEITASGEIGGARVGKPRHSRIPRMASGEWMAAMILMRPRQRWHSRTSTSHTRFMSSAHV